jgi:hypothetical protein
MWDAERGRDRFIIYTVLLFSSLFSLLATGNYMEAGN